MSGRRSESQRLNDPHVELHTLLVQAKVISVLSQRRSAGVSLPLTRCLHWLFQAAQDKMLADQASAEKSRARIAESGTGWYRL